MISDKNRYDDYFSPSCSFSNIEKEGLYEAIFLRGMSGRILLLIKILPGNVLFRILNDAHLLVSHNLGILF
jgi:hypothetical protein